jgi:hypothetical protein
MFRTTISSLLLLLCGCAAPIQKAMATEQLPYQIERSLGDNAEIRSYGSVIVAETVIEGADFGDAGNAGFRRLAGYIFGGNQREARIAMTAPVAMAADSPAATGSAESLTTSRDENGGWRMSFYMPEGSSMDTLPRPTDSRVELRTLAPRRVAAIRFSGRGTPAQFAQAESSLKAMLTVAGIATRGSPWTARYNAPWVLPPFRRNEVLIELAPE